MKNVQIALAIFVASTSVLAKEPSLPNPVVQFSEPPGAPSPEQRVEALRQLPRVLAVLNFTLRGDDRKSWCQNVQSQIKIDKLGPCETDAKADARPSKVSFGPASVIITVSSDEDRVSPATYIFQVEYSSRPARWNKTPRKYVATVHFRLPGNQLRISHPSDLPFISLP